ncbi:hypothetical protein F8154_05635 [Alkaliphilus pronyensis]|uniref:Uncharacterized protein n=1 Tax=Alkaliphilus pronyensis TaxID=1482732 RepID=A0A6I0FHY5_9FIRM|nr:hypothetical protein [Alkaliphilus pronyensis]KAB3535781.1 hypothetical protein F8154_05635 [Alkaliphilus pronyensis]
MVYKFDIKQKVITTAFLLFFLIKSIYSIFITTKITISGFYIGILTCILIRFIYIFFYKITLLDKKMILNGLVKKEIAFKSIKKIVINKKSVNIETLQDENIILYKGNIGKFDEFASNLSIKINNII